LFGNGSQLTGLPENYGNANVSSFLPTYTGVVGAGSVSATGNIQGNYVLGNGALLTGLPATYSNANVAAFLPTYSGNISAGNVSAVSNITAAVLKTSGVTGNIVGANYVSANFYLGDGGLLSNIGSNYSNANVANFLPTYSGTVTANVVSATGNITGNYFIGNGSQLTGITAGTNYSNANVSAFLPVYTGNIAAGNVSATGNIAGNYILGNGALLTGITANYSNANVSAFLPTYTGNIQAGNINTIGNVGNITGADYVIANYFVGDGGNLQLNRANTHIIPSLGNAYTLGNATNPWQSLFVSGNTIFVGNVAISTGGSNTLFVGNEAVVTLDATNPGNIGFTGNVTANYFIGDGSQLTNLPLGNYSNANVANFLPTYSGAVTANTVSATGNITGSFILGNGSQLTGISANYSNANVTAFLPTYSGNLSAGNISTTGTTGNISGPNIVTANTYLGSGGSLDLTNMTGHIVPATTNAYTLGNSLNRWNSAWIAGTVTGGYFSGDGGGLSNVGGGGSYGNADVIVLLANYGNNIISTTSSITAANFVGDGSLLTNLPPSPSTYGNANVAAYLPTDSTIIGISSNITTLQGQVYANANVAAYLPTYSGNITANVITANTVTANIAGANVVGEVAVANTVSNPVQSNITAVGTLTSLSTGSLNISGQLTANGNAQFNGNVFFAGNVTLPGNINQISGNSGQFFGNASSGFGALYAGLPAGYTLLNQEITQFAASFAGYTQVSLRNIDGGGQATGDFVVTADNGTDTSNYIDMGFTGSGYNGALANNSLGTSVFDNDGYLYTQGNASTGHGNLVIGSNQANGVVRIIAGASNLADVRITVSASGANINGTVTAANFVGDGSQLTNLPQASSIGTVTTGATITPAATNTQYNVTALAQSATIAAPSGSPQDGAKLVIRILDNGTAQSLTWNAIYQTVGTTLPTTTVANQIIYVGCIYNSQSSSWNVVSVAQ
jgi:hypothetical protein